MEKEPEPPKTLGQAIDELVHSLGSLSDVSRITAIRSACDHLKIPLFDSAPTAPSATGTSPLAGQQVPRRVTDIKSFRNEKQPSSGNEMAAIVAFYLSELAPEAERKAEVQTEDMVKYFKQAGFPLPKQPRMLLTNAKNSGYFDSGGSGGYKLNAVGYNLVAHNLPRVTGASTTTMRRRRPRPSMRKPATKRTKRS